MNYDVTYFINKFEAIPEGRWCTGSLREDRAYCALGHCGMVNTLDATEEASALAELFVKYLGIKKHGYDWVFYTVYPLNDGREKYNLPTPKQRILAALYDIKAMQQEENRIDITKSLAILPVDEKSDLVPETKLINGRTTVE